MPTQEMAPGSIAGAVRPMMVTMSVVRHFHVDALEGSHLVVVDVDVVDLSGIGRSR